MKQPNYDPKELHLRRLPVMNIAMSLSVYWTRFWLYGLLGYNAVQFPNQISVYGAVGNGTSKANKKSS